MSDSEEGIIISDDGGKSDGEEEVGSGGSLPGSTVPSGGDSPVGSPADSPIGSPVGSPMGSPLGSPVGSPLESPIGSPVEDVDDEDDDDMMGREAEEVPEGEEGEIIEGAEEEEEEGEDLDQIDNEEDEEEDEKEDEDEFMVNKGSGPPRKKRKRKTGGIMDFILQEADVDEDGGEDEEEDGWEEGAKDLIDREPAVVDDNELHGAHRLQQIWSKENEKGIEYYRWALQQPLHCRFHTNAITQQRLLPGVKTLRANNYDNNMEYY